MNQDPLSEFVEEGHKEPPGPRVKLKMRKEQGSAGFCLKASGSPEAVKRLAEIMNGIDLSKHQLPEGETSCSNELEPGEDIDEIV